MKKLRLIPLCLMLCVCLAPLACAYTASLYKEDGTTLIKSVEFTKGSITSIPELKHTETKYYLGYVTADGKQLHNYNIHTEYEGDLNLTARGLTRREMVPGENFVENGTFDEDSINWTSSNGTLTIVSEKDGNRVLEYSRGSAYASIQHYTKWDPGRKYRVSYRYMIPEGATTVKNSINPRYWKSQAEIDSYENGGYQPGNNTAGNKAGVAGQWTTHSLDFAINANCIYDYRMSALSLYAEPIQPEGHEDRFGIVYYDDIEIIPFHKITYNPNGGTLTSGGTAYQLDGIYTVDSSIVPAREGYTFLGWGKTPDASANVGEIELSGKDVTLYARWQGAESQPVFMYNFANDTKGIADGAMSIVAKDGAEGYTSVTLYYADAEGILEGYTPLKTLAITNGVATYGISGKRAFPMEATKIYVVFSAEGKSDYTYVYDIPEDKRITESKTPIVSFYSASDAHNAVNDYNLDGRAVTYNRNNAFADMVANKANYDFVVLNGDSVCHSTTGDYAKFDAFRKQFNDNGIPLFFGVGNHEFHVSKDGKEKPELKDGNEELFLEILDDQQAYLKTQGIELDREPNGWYYSFEVNGMKFIVCATPYPNYATDTCDYTISGEQLKWLDEQLFDAEKSNKPVFVFSHVGVKNYIPPYNEGGLSGVNELEEVLNRHANLFFGTAHTHTNINVDWHTVAAGNQKTQYTHYNEGSLAYTREYDEEFNDLGYETDYCICYYIEIYDDMVVFKGRKIDDEADGGSKFISHAHYQIMMPDAGKELPDLSLGNSVADGTVLTPVLSKAYESGVATYSWYIDGKVVSTENTYKVSVNSDTCGKRIACRVTFEDGAYVSAVTDEIPGYKVTFDINGGTGGSAMSAQDVVPDSEFTPNMPTLAPTMAGRYFAGWSVNKNAAEPDASFFANGDMTLYAVWKAGYTLSYDANGGTGSVPSSHVVPEGLAQPYAAKPFPKLEGKFFTGWADTKDATAPMAKVNVNSDMTLYAVYTNEPKWYFDASLSGFEPNSIATSTTIEDGALVTVSPGGDQSYTWKNGSFAAADYPYLRLKGKTDGAIDGVFFQSDAGGFSESRHFVLSQATVVAELDGFKVYEFDILNIPQEKDSWYGTISALRYDSASKAETSVTDYLVFTDKLGVFKADVTVDEANKAVTLSEETVNCSASAAWNETILGKTVTVTLTPDEGYEFTTREDVLAFATINGEKPDGAVVLADGSAKIWKGESGGVEFGNVSGDCVTASVKVDAKASGNDVVVAIYSGDTLCGLKIFHDAVIDSGVIDVVAEKSLGANEVKVFVFSSFDAMKPLTEPSSAVLD